MNLHQIGREPRTLHLNTEHVTRTPPRYRGNELLVHNFVTEYDEAALRCNGCGNRQWRKRITEVWERYDHVEFPSVSPNQHYDVYASRSSADYYDDQDEDPWECGLCGYAPSEELCNLLDDLEKEHY